MKKILIIAILIAINFVQLESQKNYKYGTEMNTIKHPEWSYNQSIYEVNLRQFSKNGTFQEFEEHLPHLKQLGVGILWFMPIHPIGEKNRKGTLGRYYSVKDYLNVNPAHGTLEEFKQLVKKIHKMGMYVIIDWVANHCAWDNQIVYDHPDWFTKDENGNHVSPVKDWADVIDFNFDNQEMRKYMLDALKFWIKEIDIDGFRCDVAGMVPIDFWNKVRLELDQIKPVFMLAEWETPELHKQAFDMSYNWKLFKIMNAIAAGKKNASHIDAHLIEEKNTFALNDFRMTFTSNHDENSWNGTVYERLGKAAEVFAVLSLTFPGMPLVYSGQEACLDKRLSFFDKDEIEWKDCGMKEIYTKLLNLKKENKALWNGFKGGELQRIHTSNDKAVFTYTRQVDNDKIFVITNLSPFGQSISLQENNFTGEYNDIFEQEKVIFSGDEPISLKSWEYKVLIQKNQ